MEVVVPNEDRRLSAGSFVKAAIVTRTDDKARTVPEEAIVNFAGVTKVFIVDGDKVREVQIKTGVALIVAEGQRKRTWIEVEGDLPTGARSSRAARLAWPTASRCACGRLTDSPRRTQRSRRRKRKQSHKDH